MSPEFQPSDQQRYATALRQFDEENAQDPNREHSGGLDRPRELVYAEWLTEWVTRLCPQASEELRLAARCQHLCRWQVPRDSYPMTRAGYLRWREDLKKFHAEKAGGILRAAGYPEDFVQRVQDLNLKRNFPADPNSRVLEDALCLVFLEHQLGELAAKTSDEKMVNAVQKSWQKMTPAAHALALTLNYTPAQRALLERALSKSPQF